jgi:putative endonuclease
VTPAENHWDAGRRGEDLALAHLEAIGYRLVIRNYRFGRGEIDLIMDAPDGTLVFVEVKSNRATEKGRPLERLDARKMQRLQRLAQRYVWQAGQEHRDMRFDAVGVDLFADGRAPRIEHHEAAFLPDGALYR